MKKIFGNILAGTVVLYILSLTVMMPYYNWRYAKEHGFIKWVFLGEIVATLKSVAWPYFVFFTTHDSISSSPDERHYINSKKACDEALQIVVKAGDVTRVPSNDREKVTKLLELAISEASQIQIGYLQKVHPQFPEKYERNYKYALSIMMQGLQTDNTPLILAGSYGYNEFAEWMRAHEKELSF